MDLLVATEECDEGLRGNYGEPTQFRYEPSVRSGQMLINSHSLPYTTTLSVTVPLQYTHPTQADEFTGGARREGRASSRINRIMSRQT